MLEMGQELGVQGACPCTGCGACLVAVPGEMGLPPDVPEAGKVSQDAFEIPSEEQ